MSTGRLFVVVGPSGVGKDSLMREAVRLRPDLHLVRRVITRPEAAGGEDFEGVSEPEFAARLSHGDFVLHWRAHGLSYGVPKAVRAVLDAGQDAVLNGSRAVLRETQEAFPNLVVIHVTAQPRVLAERLAARGRESADDIARRLKRAAMPLPEGLNKVVEIDNSGDFASGVQALLDALRPLGAKPGDIRYEPQDA
ncbi:phosphonate metabolism protein/1,5-bisphosphokinase (PRPP-forming) PhnN [Sinisalibacter aestuarii]|uniref:Ribose 1,5-bisphosphate phosphokinase PhnN n=1 Tax=Sinisalibacter aestuarii TaxID=2949426 RepID=A0ABQ5LNF6_9RHOB|nr:phosphonate metabolism protein/1,5-bisphosphokinase (PRPP-forming) PhnN [Sinisalibacter aestuarii]GKY86539.1 ribose 1,5-bisphosphate phosphokinase PhnN [Sinisalibacter aestuarii]